MSEIIIGVDGTERGEDAAAIADARLTTLRLSA